jgi:Transmembrane secretion effector
MKYTSPAALPASDAAWTEGGDAVGKDAAQFAVEIGLVRAERRHGCDDRRVFMRPVKSGRCQQLDRTAIETRMHSVAVEFDFVQPVGPLRCLLGLSTAFGLTTPGVILVASFLFGTTLAFGMPLFQAIVPDLVPRHELAPAVSLNSYVVVVAVLLRWLPPLPPVEARDGRRIAHAVLDGLRHTIGTAATRATLIRSSGFAFFATLYFSLLPPIARDQVSGSAGTYGLLLGCLGAGGISAVVLLPRWRARWSRDRIARIGSFGSAIFLAALAGCHALWSIVPVLLLAGVAWVAVVATINVAAQVALPAWVRARGLSIFMIVFNGMMALGSAFWGLWQAPSASRQLQEAVR